MQRIFTACIRIATFQCMFFNHWPFSCIFIPTKFDLFFTCSLISVMTDGQAEKGKSKFIIRNEWYVIISHFSSKLIIML